MPPQYNIYWGGILVFINTIGTYHVKYRRNYT